MQTILTDDYMRLLVIAFICLAAVAFLAEMRTAFLISCALVAAFGLPMLGIDVLGIAQDVIRSFL